MDQLRFAGNAYRVMHEHRDGSWGEMQEVRRSHESAAGHDPERQWLLGRLFRCTSCDESVTLAPSDDLGQEPVTASPEPTT